MRVHIDETRRDEYALGVDFALCGPESRANGGDVLAAHGEGGASRASAATVDQGAAPFDQSVLVQLPSLASVAARGDGASRGPVPDTALAF